MASEACSDDFHEAYSLIPGYSRLQNTFPFSKDNDFVVGCLAAAKLPNPSCGRTLLRVIFLSAGHEFSKITVTGFETRIVTPLFSADALSSTGRLCSLFRRTSSLMRHHFRSLPTLSPCSNISKPKGISHRALPPRPSCHIGIKSH